ncbi:uncharacterized protein LOC111916532 [Lactuca sativa]|uniref:uncharacterized protein LOC111916532 n=1 Tax=Lactuca sativa TaxID=4236 RepID=UPI000CD83501|nr:uncharacterized protein LOC111916532 [Lactuca sativa]
MDQGSSSSGSGMYLEDIVKSLATCTQTFQNETKANINTLEQQMTQLAASVSKLEPQGKLPVQTEKNTKHSACAITLRNGKEYEGPKMIEEEEEMELEKEEEKSKAPSKQVPIEVKVTPPPFPTRLSKSKREREDNKIMEMFRKVEVNIPLIDAIKQVPRYAKFLKELCTSKKILKVNETVKVGENVSAVLQKRLPQKYKDPGVFMKTGVIIQLAGRSLVHPKGVIEDVLLQLNELVFPADFYVLDMDDDDSPNLSSILLGRPFLKTARTKIDVYHGTLSLEFDGGVINFNIYDAMRYPSDISSLNFVDVIKPLTEDCFDLSNLDVLALILDRNLQKDEVEKLSNQFKIDEEILEVVSCMDQKKKMRFNVPKLKLPMPNEKLVPSIVQAPELELKTLPEHLKYAYLREKETLSVIISTKLSTKVEEELVTTLKEYKEAIGWTIADIKGLSPSLCMHKILMEEDYKPSREAQRCLNPPLVEVVKKVILKLLNVGMIYPILNSKWADAFWTLLCSRHFSKVHVYGNSFHEYLSNLKKILQRCIETNLVLNYEKCHFMVDKGLILGHVVSSKGLEVEKPKIDVIKSLPYPTCVHQLKELLISAPILQSPDWSLPFEIMCDASNHAVGVLLGQRKVPVPNVIYYVSKTPYSDQANYSTTEKELLSIVFALDKFRQYLIGSKVLVYSDHATIRYLLAKKDLKPRLI